MAEYFLDTSAFVKNYVDESGSDAVRGILNSKDEDDHGVYVATVTLVEAVAAVRGRGRRPGGNVSDTTRIVATLRREFPELVIAVGVSKAVIDDAADMAATHVLRGYDAVQLAVARIVGARCRAMGLGALTVVSADGQLNVAAAAEGLDVLDPTQ